MKYLFGLFLFSVLSIGCKPAVNVQANQVDFKNVDVTGAVQMIAQNPNLIILDVRTPGETAEGKISNAIEIDYKSSDFDSKIAKLDKSKSYLVYCKSGGRSVGASKKMIKAGFSDITNMEGGYNAWK